MFIHVQCIDGSVSGSGPHWRSNQETPESRYAPPSAVRVPTVCMVGKASAGRSPRPIATGFWVILSVGVCSP